MEFRTMEIKLCSGKNLHDVNLFRKMAVYAVIWISGGDTIPKQKTRTPTDHGGTNPIWNFPMHFKVDEAALQLNRISLKFKILCEQSSGDDKTLGELGVPIKELLDSPAAADTGGNKFHTYQVRKPSGRLKGELNFTCKLSEKMADPSAPPPPPPEAEERNLKKTIDSGLELGKNVLAIGKSATSKLVKAGWARLGSALGKKKREFGRAWRKYMEEDNKPVHPNPTPTQTQPPNIKWATTGIASRILAKRKA